MDVMLVRVNPVIRLPFARSSLPDLRIKDDVLDAVVVDQSSAEHVSIKLVAGIVGYVDGADNALLVRIMVRRSGAMSLIAD